MRSMLFFSLIIFLMSGCATQVPSSSQVTLMTFNVENLFDTKHDEGKNDYTYLPLEHKASQSHQDACKGIEVTRWREQCLYWDWSETVLDTKLRRIADGDKAG